jgi:hypothetical protein
MLSLNCGFQDSPQGQKLLVYHGPIVWVDVGFDPKYKGDARTRPTPARTCIEALVDTGAEEGCIDSSFAAQLGLPIVDRRKVCGIEGSMEVNMHLAQIHIPGLKFTLQGAFAGVHLVAGGHPYKVLMGRTFLSHFSMEYDGPTGAVTISAR